MCGEGRALEDMESSEKGFVLATNIKGLFKLPMGRDESTTDRHLSSAMLTAVSEPSVTSPGSWRHAPLSPGSTFCPAFKMHILLVSMPHVTLLSPPPQPHS